MKDKTTDSSMLKFAAAPFGRAIAHDLSTVNDGGAAWSEAHGNFLSILLETELRDLMSCSRELELKPRDQLFGAGDSSRDVFIVAEGCIRLYQVSSTGKETILWYNFPGEIFGIAELWSGDQRQVYAVANEASRVYSIRRQDFIDFLGAHPEAAMKAIGILSARIRSLGQMLVGLTSDNVETRIARLLMRFASISSGSSCCAPVAEQELCVNVRLRHQDIANLIGASRQTVTTTLLQLRKSGAVRMVDRHIHIVQPGHLLHLLELSAA